MKRAFAFIVTAAAVMGLACGPAMADDAKDGGNQTTTAPKSDDPVGLIKTILNGYRAYLQQLNNLLAESDGQAAKTTDQTNAKQAGESKGAPTVQPSGTLQTSTLQTSHVQGSGPLNEVHLAGYPALPDVPPTSSVLYLTQEQIARKKQMDREQMRLKQFYLEHP